MWGAPKWPPTPPSARHAPAKPGRASITRSRAEAGQDVGGYALELLALLLGLADGVDDDVVAAGRAEPLDLLGALLGGADDAVLLRERLEVLGVALREELHPGRLRRLVVAADGDEGQMRGREVIELPPRLLRG